MVVCATTIRKLNFPRATGTINVPLKLIARYFIAFPSTVSGHPADCVVAPLRHERCDLFPRQDPVNRVTELGAGMFQPVQSVEVDGGKARETWTVHPDAASTLTPATLP